MKKSVNFTSYARSRMVFSLLVFSLFAFASLSAMARHPLLDESSRNYEPQHWQNELQFNYFKATANYSSEGGSYTDLPSGAEYQLTQIDFGSRYTMNHKWAFYLTSQWAQASAKYANKSYENNSLTYLQLGADHPMISEKNWSMLADGSVLFPLQRYAVDSSQTFNQEGAAEITGRVILKSKLNNIHPFASIGLTYRDENRSSLLPWAVGAELALSTFSLGAELRGFQSILRESKSTTLEKSSRTLAANGQSLQFNSSNPNLLETNFWLESKISARWAVKAGGQYTMTGASYAAGWGGFAMLRFDLDEKSWAQKINTRQKQKNDEINFDENTSDGVDQKLFVPDEPITNDGPVPNSEYRKKAQKQKQDNSNVEQSNQYKIKLKKKSKNR